MSYFAKKQLFFYRYLKIDIWGLVRNNLQYKINKVSYNYNNIYYEAKIAERQGFLKKSYYKWNKFIVYNTIMLKKKKRWSYAQYVSESRCKSIFYFYLLFYFFRTTIKNKLYNIYKVFFLDNKKFFQKRYYPVPFIYEPRVYFRKKKLPKINMRRINFQLIRLFYIMYSYNQLNRLIKKIKRLNGSFEQNFILFMECKLPSFIYRSSFFSNMFESISFINGGNLWINKEVVSSLYYTIKVMDFVGFYSFLKGYIFWSFFKRIRRKAFLFSFPKYMYISLTFIFIILIRMPLSKDIINPISADAYKISNYI